MVATNSLTDIPLAYMYREGDYATRVDIIILSSRPWHHSAFPPPENIPNQHHPQPHLHNQQHNQLINHGQSSSSSSNNAPSEPTIDYSSWSPRSYQIAPSTPLDWIPKKKRDQTPLPHTPNFLLLDRTPTSLALNSNGGPTRQLNPSDSDRTYLPVSTHRPQKILVTHDHATQGTIRRICSLINALLPSIPGPVAITPFLSLRSLHYGVMIQWESRDNTVLRFRDSPSFVQHATEEDSYTQRNQIVPDSSARENLYTHPGQSKWALELGGPNPLRHLQVGTSQVQLCTLNLDHIQAEMDDSSAPPFFPSSSPISFQISPDQHLHCPQEMNTQTIQNASPPPHPTLDPLLSVQPTRSQESAHPTPNNPTPGHKQNRKSGQLPTRRSERIQAKTRADKIPGKARSRSTGIHFDLQTSLDSLDANSTVEILQTSGLQIDARVEQLIDDAINKDRADNATQCSMPSTPLHDLIPPLLIPGTDMML